MSENNNSPKICFITAIYGGYERTCKPFTIQTIATDFICFTDSINIIANGWIIDTNPYHLIYPSPLDNDNCVNSVKKNLHTFNIAKYYKQSFYLIPRLKDYDVIVWLDGTVGITSQDTSYWILSKIKKYKIIGWEHPYHFGKLGSEVEGSLYDRYISTFWFNQKQPYQDINMQWKVYSEENYDTEWFKKEYKQIYPSKEPSIHLGVWVTCFVAFLQKDTLVKEILDTWYYQTLNYTTQDQIGFPYALFKHKLLPLTLPNDEISGDFSKSIFHIKYNHGN